MKFAYWFMALQVALIGILASGCAPEKKPQVAFETVEQARAQARDNAGYNAQMYRANSPQYQTYNVQNNGDSSQSNECPQGDGWASLKLVNPNNVKDIVNIKCSTVSGGIGCLLADEFKSKPAYSGDEGNCQPTNKVPFPLPKIAGK
jgi:type II secretory pathway pseudopilin PulG